MENQRFMQIKLIIEFIVLLGVLVFLLAACLGSAGFYEGGVYEGEGRGFNGPIRIRLTLSRAGIEDIELLENDEYAFAVSAMEELLELALEYNTTNLDAISGATISSEGFLSALDDALQRGRR